RYHRMKGEATLMLPGADHAGFETQVVYEKLLEKQGESRFDYSREELYKQIWDFVAQNKNNYEVQMRKLGASLDWNRYVFTLDPKIVKRAYGTFKRMWEDGLIYRGERLVNFCTFHGTAFADIEVSYKNEPGHLWYIKYPLTDGGGELTVATTRPETMLGDTAVAVNPKDDRYKNYVGKTVKLPLTNREIPVIADDYVDMEYGTGAVKITPAHDPNDFEIGQRHDLPMISVIDHEGNMSAEAGDAYRGQKLEVARKQIVENLKNQGLLKKTEAITHSVGHCYKCDTVIQPLLREQWFIDMQPLAQSAIETLKAGKIKFYPANKKTQLIRYLEGLRDWNISRQIAWGIPIPAFQNADEPDDWIYDERVEQEEIKIGSKTYRRDPDVFDTWFSSGQWPYATLDYPDGKDFEQFYP
ncbi:MAG: class I tRNA ligase family protein, partial [Minisyncoccia bacterium]